MRAILFLHFCFCFVYFVYTCNNLLELKVISFIFCCSNVMNHNRRALQSKLGSKHPQHKIIYYLYIELNQKFFIL